MQPSTEADFDREPMSLDQKALQLARQPLRNIQKLRRVGEVLSHYSLPQMARRLKNLIRQRLQPNRLVGPVLVEPAEIKSIERVNDFAGRVIGQNANHPSHGGCDLSTGQFMMLSHLVALPKNIFNPSVLNQQTHLWRFQFHYHEFLLTQAALGNWSQVSDFLSAWLAACPPEKTRRTDDAWHPFCISRRSVAWVWLLNAADKNQLSSSLVSALVESLSQQMEFLSRNLERDLGGNHLLENATALAIVGGVLETKSAAKFRRLAASVFAAELPKQILPHGEHFELSPMYHCQILSNLLRIEICCSNDSPLMELITPAIDRMLSFLRSILHPDGEIPLLADSGFYEAPSVAEIEMAAEFTGRKKPNQAPLGFRTSGDYQVFQSDHLSAIVDFGPVAAKNLPAHGHCDATTLEVSVEDKRWIVDSGNFNYADDAMRHFCRSSIGHNVVTVNDLNQAHVWSKFRMGTRPTVSGHANSLSDHATVTEGWHWTRASHNGYRKLGVAELSRLVAFCPTAIVCCDGATSTQTVDRLDDQHLVGHVHLHPDVQLKLVHDRDGTAVYRLNCEGDRRWLTVAADKVTIAQGWYCEGFGRRRKRSVIRYIRNNPTTLLGWMLHDFGPEAGIEFTDKSILIKLGDSSFAFSIT